MNKKEKTSIARAHTNIALVKYWGKKNEKLKLPETGSLSITLDRFYTDTSVHFDKHLTKDQITFNGKRLNEEEGERISTFLNLIREKASLGKFAAVDTINHVPTSSGFASSASGFAALAAASAKASGLKIDSRSLSRLARRGSGSACRSIYSGFVEWQKGFSDQTSYATQINSGKDWDLSLLAVELSTKKKKLSSTEAMKITKFTSPYYREWKKVVKNDLASIKEAIKNHDFANLGKISELNALRMHSLTLSADPPFTYFNEDTLAVLSTVFKLRKHGIECYCTIDAGPNVKVLVQKANVSKVKSALQKQFGTDKVLETGIGSGVSFLN